MTSPALTLPAVMDHEAPAQERPAAHGRKARRRHPLPSPAAASASSTASRLALNSVDLDVCPGEVVALLGHSGSGQVHPDEDPHRHRPVHRGRARRRRPRRRRADAGRPARAALRRRLCLPALQPGPPAQRAHQRAHRRPARRRPDQPARHVQQRAAAPGPWTSWTASASPTRPSSPAAASAAASSSASPSPAPSCSSPASSSPTNPSPPWTPASPGTSWACCATSPARTDPRHRQPARRRTRPPLRGPRPRPALRRGRLRRPGRPHHRKGGAPDLWHRH